MVMERQKTASLHIKQIKSIDKNATIQCHTHKTLVESVKKETTAICTQIKDKIYTLFPFAIENI